MADIKYASDIINDIYKTMVEQYGKGCVKKDKVKEIFDLAIAKITTEMCHGNAVNIRGFGKFFVKEVKPRRCYDLSKGKFDEVPAHGIPRFYPCQDLRTSVK